VRASEIVAEVEAFGGAFKVEYQRDAGLRLLFKLGVARRNRALAAKLNRMIRQHGQQIGELVILRELFEIWEPAPGARIQ
jgi:hypothetical protein